MQIIRTQTNSDTDTLKQVHLKVQREDDKLDRWLMEAHMYPNYDEQVRVKIPGLGFTLFLNDAKNLHALLTEALKEFKDTNDDKS